MGLPEIHFAVPIARDSARAAPDQILSLRETRNGLITVAIFSVYFNNELIRHVGECGINGRIIKGFRVPAVNVHFSYAMRITRRRYRKAI
jgi:hypothetical protein